MCTGGSVFFWQVWGRFKGRQVKEKKRNKKGKITCEKKEKGRQLEEIFLRRDGRRICAQVGGRKCGPVAGTFHS